MNSNRRKTSVKTSSSSPSNEKWLWWLLIPILIVVVYAPFLKGPFLYDDQPHVLRNQTVTSFKGLFDLHSVGAFFLTPFGLSARPLLYLTYALNYQMFGFDSSAFRATNMLIHLVNATLLFLLTRRIAQIAGRKRSQAFWIGIAAASVFAVHPLVTEAITYIAGRSASLCAMFYLGGLVMIIEAGFGKRMRWMPVIGAVVCFIIAMLVKQDAAMLPIAAIALVLFVWPDNRTIRERVIVTAVLLVAEVLVFAAFQSSIKAIASEARDNAFLVSGGSEPTLPLVPYVLTSVKEWFFYYFWRLFVPIHQNVDPPSVPITSPNLLVLIAAIVIAGLVVLGYFMLKRDRLLGASFVLLLLSPLAAYCVFPLADVVAEHRAYLAAAGAAMLIAAVCSQIQKWQIAIVVLLVVVYSWLAVTRNSVWMDVITLWEDASSKAPEKLRPHMNLGLEYEARGRVDLAISHYKFVLAKNSDHFAARTNLAALYLAQNDTKDAEELLAPAVAKNVKFAPVYVNLAAVRIQQGQFESALALLDRAKEINPRQIQVAFTRGIAYTNMNRPDLAIPEYLHELEVEPYFTAAQVELGKAYERMGEREKAISYYQKVVEVEPSNPEALQGLARLVATKLSK
jgi:tetratricopeptide (TPR) repeat protein